MASENLFLFFSWRNKEFSNVFLDDILLTIYYIWYGLKGMLFTHDVLCLIEESEGPSFIPQAGKLLYPPKQQYLLSIVELGYFCDWIKPQQQKKINWMFCFGLVFCLLEYTAKSRTETSMVSWAGIIFSYDLGWTQPAFLGEYINTGKRLVWTDSTKKVMK